MGFAMVFAARLSLEVPEVEMFECSRSRALDHLTPPPLHHWTLGNSSSSRQTAMSGGVTW